MLPECPKGYTIYFLTNRKVSGQFDCFQAISKLPEMHDVSALVGQSLAVLHWLEFVSFENWFWYRRHKYKMMHTGLWIRHNNFSPTHKFLSMRHQYFSMTHKWPKTLNLNLYSVNMLIYELICCQMWVMLFLVSIGSEKCKCSVSGKFCRTILLPGKFSPFLPQEQRLWN